MRYNKFRNKKVTIDGIDFQSIKEGSRYKQLRLLERAGLISELKMQTAFVLQPTFYKNGKTYRSITYKADFDYMTKDGSRVIEDVKGVETDVFKIKRKLFEYKYPEYELKIIK